MVIQTSVMVMLILVSKHREMKNHFPDFAAVAPEQEVIIMWLHFPEPGPARPSSDYI